MYLAQRQIVRGGPGLVASSKVASGGASTIAPYGVMRSPGHHHRARLSCRPPVMILRSPGRGLGDVNSQAAAALISAGYTGMTCAPVHISNPGGDFWENQCTSPSFPGETLIADNVVQQSSTSLKAQLAEEAPYQGQSQQQFNESIAALTGNAGAIAAAASNDPNVNNTQFAASVAAMPNSPTKTLLMNEAAYSSGGGAPSPAAAPPVQTTTGASPGGFSIQDLVSAFQAAGASVPASSSTSSSSSSFLTSSVFGIPVWGIALGLGALLLWPRR
jgi:hypothetical protein